MAQGGLGLYTLSREIAFPDANLGGFGDLQTVEMTPLLNLSFVTGLRDQLVSTTVANSATVDTNASRLRLQSGTNSAGSAIASSVRPCAYRAGQGITAKFTALFTLGVADSIQIVGMGNATDGYFFGYNGEDFGVLHRNGGASNWTAQTAWNGDRCDGNGPSGMTLNPAYGTPLKIVYPFLGYGDIRFYVLDPETCTWILAHNIRYANTSVSTQLSNPTLGFYAQSINSGATSNQIIYVGSVGVFLDGQRSFYGPQFAANGSEAGVTTEANILAIRNATSLNGVTNRALMRLRQISFASQGGNGVATFFLRRAATLTGTTTFTAISGTTADDGVTLTAAQSMASINQVATFSGGSTIWNATINNGQNYTIDLTSQDIFIAPTETLLITGSSTASSTLSAAINWQEDVQ